LTHMTMITKTEFRQESPRLVVKCGRKRGFEQ